MFSRFRHSTAGAGLTAAVAMSSQARGVRYTSIQETLKPIAGQSAGQMSILNDICCNPDAEEERRKPVFRSEVVPKRAESSFLRTMYLWGYNSLTLFQKTNEDPGPWWNANSSTLVSNWSQVGDYANAGMWSGVWRYTYGVGQYNLRPYEARGRAWGRRDKKSSALVVDYQDSLKQSPVQKYMFPHTKEHQQHRRFKNPALKDYKELNGLHGKRVLREIQYHLGQGLRFYLVDGVFGSHPATSTPYRIITDNPTHAYFASLAAIRKFNYVAQQEIMLVKRVSQSPIDEWGWRRPGVLVYHAPGFDFEMPRIVEEFGGPRPQDLSLTSSKFVALEPYSIPMKGIIGAEPSCDTLLDTTAFLCARWGFYADDRGLLTVVGDSVISPDGSKLTLVINASVEDADALRASKHLFGARHHRIGGDWVSRAWDVTSAPVGKLEAHRNDIIESSLGRIQQALPTRIGLADARSHRQYGRRNVSEYGFKYPHNYTTDAATKAAAGGHLFGAQKTEDKLAQHLVRPNAFSLKAVDIVVVGEGDAAAAIVKGLKDGSALYAEEDKLQDAFKNALGRSGSVKVVPPGAAKALIQKLAASGAAK